MSKVMLLSICAMCDSKKSKFINSKKLVKYYMAWIDL